uniref:G patch domain-containing protein 1 (Trinotate prediction) n=1 Tax=Myxobolus squamalis TaxID=59785 RepID=A0A6B2G5K6_MYXSQ
MSSSDYENEANKSTNDKKFVDTNDYVLFGTPIELNEDELETGKKIMKMEDQVATDDKGRRRFHGAFTGGFSAGYFNSCGSEQGWAPSTFISSRSDRNTNDLQKPENFMDEEDFGEFGIAPKKYSAKSKFYNENKSIKSEIDQSMESHKVLRSIIPDDQLYNSLNIVRKATVGFDLMRKMGWKEGRGFGENVSIDKTNPKDSKV